MRGLRGRAIVICGASMALPNFLSPAGADEAETWSLPAALRQITDIAGVRTSLEKAGIRFIFTYYGDGFADPLGGVKQGAGYDGRFGAIMDADLYKLLGWQGATFHASVHQIHGTEFSATNLANLMTVSGIEAPASTRLFNLWIEQKIGADLNLRVGQFTAGQEFLTSDNADLFINSTFGWPMAEAQDLPSGGSAFPEATPGVRLTWTPSNVLTLRAAAFDGNPAGPGPGTPVQRDPFGLAFRVNDPPFFIFESELDWGNEPPSSGDPNQEGTDVGGGIGRNQSSYARANLPGELTLGAWLHAGSFADQRFDDRGGLLAVSGGTPLQHSGNFAAYTIVDQELWRLPGRDDRGLNGFLRLSASPSDRNPVDLYADGGLTFKGPFAGRPGDIVGLALAWGRISPLAQDHDRDIVALTGQSIPIRNYELALELSYQYRIAQRWIIQPDLQYIVHPGGHAPLPGAGGSGIASPATASIPDALVFGIRTSVKF